MESLIKDTAALTNTVRKLQRDVSKLEVFRKTLMQSLHEEEEASTGATPIAKPTPNEDDGTFPPTRTSSMRSQISEAGNSSFAEDHEPESSRPGISHGFLLASQTSTPRLTPPGSPPSVSDSVSPTRTSNRCLQDDIQFHFRPQEACLMTGHPCFLLCTHRTVQYQAPTRDHKLGEFEWMGKNSFDKSGTDCPMSSLAHFWQMLRN